MPNVPQDLIIIGAGGFGREVAWLVQRINQKSLTWNLIGFVDDDLHMQGMEVDGYPMLGNCEEALNHPQAAFVCAIGSARVREAVVERLESLSNGKIRFATLIDPDALVSQRVSVGEGTIICAHAIVTVDITIGRHVIINLDCTVGHDATLGDFVTLYPSVNVSGMTVLENGCELGTGTQLIQNKKVGTYAIVGAGAVIVKDIPEKCTAVGIPAKPIKFFD